MKPDRLKRFWRDFLASQPALDPGTPPYPAEAFGDGPELADELVELILTGAKTATCSCLWEWEAEQEALPQPGQRTIVTDGSGRPRCVIEITEVTVRPFDAVDATFARQEGEGDRSLAAWREAHWGYFARVLPKIDRQPAGHMPLVCERFRMLYQAED